MTIGLLLARLVLAAVFTTAAATKLADRSRLVASRGLGRGPLGAPRTRCSASRGLMTT